MMYINDVCDSVNDVRKDFSDQKYVSDQKLTKAS